jgi:hypothetical protein
MSGLLAERLNAKADRHAAYEHWWTALDARTGRHRAVGIADRLSITPTAAHELTVLE